MKKLLSFFLTTAMTLSFSVYAFASGRNNEARIIDKESGTVYASSSSSAAAPSATERGNYSQAYQDKVQAAWEKAMQKAKEEKDAKPGDIQIFGMANGRPILVINETSVETTRTTRTKSNSKTLLYDFDWMLTIKRYAELQGREH